MLKYIFWAISLYFLYRFIVGFVIPVWKVSRKVKGQMRDFQNHVNQQQSDPYQSSNNGNGHQQESPKKKEGDYIDFEEVK